MKNLMTILFFLTIIMSLTFCKRNDDNTLNFYDSEYRIGFWIANISTDKSDTLQFIDELNLIRKGDFYVYEKYLYKINGDTLFICLPDSTGESKHIINAAGNRVQLSGMYCTTGLTDGSGVFFKENGDD